MVAPQQLKKEEKKYNNTQKETLKVFASYM